MGTMCITHAVRPYVLFWIRPFLISNRQPTHVHGVCFRWQGVKAAHHRCALLGSLKVKEYINLWDSCLLHIGNSSHKIICTNNQITFQIIVQSPTTMWGMVKRALQLSFLLLVELPIRLLMLLVINVLGLILPELVVWVAKTTMIRHARSSS